MKACDRNINKAIALANDMIALADRGDADREDTGCGILYGVLRDAAFKVRKLAETEKRKHRARAQALKRRLDNGAAGTRASGGQLK